MTRLFFGAKWTRGEWPLLAQNKHSPAKVVDAKRRVA
jgi:hypothetical protein